MVLRSWMFWKISSFNMIVKLLSSCVDLNVSKSITLQYGCKVLLLLLLLLLLFKLIYYHLVWTTFFIDLNVSKDRCKAIIILSITILCGLECFKRYHLHYWCMVIIIIIIWPLFRPIFYATFGHEFLFY